jgi:hypothetical protein
MNIEYTIELTDIEAFNIFTLDYIPFIKKQVLYGRIVYASIGIIFLVCGLVLLNNGEPISIIFFPASAAFIVYIFIAKSLVKKSLAKRIRKIYTSKNGDDYTGKHTFSIFPENIKDVSETSESTSSWARIYMVGVTDQHLFIILKPGLSAFIVPKDAFPDETSFKKYAETVNQYFQAYTSSIKP